MNSNFSLFSNDCTLQQYPLLIGQKAELGQRRGVLNICKPNIELCIYWPGRADMPL